MDKKNNKWLIAILVLVILGLVGYIIYDKVIINKESENEPVKVEETKEPTLEQPNYDLSNIPDVSSTCTFEFTLDEYNSFLTNRVNQDNSKYNCESELYKYVIKDVILDNVKQDVQLVSGKMSYLQESNNKSKTGIYVNGIKHELLNETALVYLSNHQNMLFVNVDSGTSMTGYVNVLAFDKKGNMKYNLGETLKKEQITDVNAKTPQTKILSSQSILRGSVKIDDSSIKFNTYTTEGDTCINNYRGSTYSVSYTNDSFEKPAYQTGWTFDNDNCAEATN